MMTAATTTATFAAATPHALVLTVSHGLVLCQPPSFAAALMPPFLTESPVATVTLYLAALRGQADGAHA
jgi:hypothetical protein